MPIEKRLPLRQLQCKISPLFPTILSVQYSACRLTLEIERPVYELWTHRLNKIWERQERKQTFTSTRL
jgi:hypothetical protein